MLWSQSCEASSEYVRYGRLGVGVARTKRDELPSNYRICSQETTPFTRDYIILNAGGRLLTVHLTSLMVKKKKKKPFSQQQL